MVAQVSGQLADIYEWGNLYQAYRKAAKGKRSRAPAAAFEFKLEDNLVQLQDELAAETYRPGAYVNFTIHEPKRRLISAAPFRDRVVHHALCQVIEPAFERSFIHHSYANRVGKGTHRALDRVPALDAALSLRAAVRCAPVLSRPSIIACCSARSTGASRTRPSAG